MILTHSWAGQIPGLKAGAVGRHVWDKAFIGGSVVASFFQGVALGAFLDGITVSGRSDAGGPLDWIAPLPLLSGFCVMIACTLLGSTWLVMKTEGEQHRRMVQVARPFALMLLASVAVVSIRTPLRDPAVADRWFTIPDIVFLAPVPFLVLLSIALLLGSLKRNPCRWPFVASLALIFLGYTGMAIRIWPRPTRGITDEEALVAAPPGCRPDPLDHACGGDAVNTGRPHRFNCARLSVEESLHFR